MFDFLTKVLEIPSSQIFVFGRSIGSGPSSYLSSIRELGGLVLMSPFTSVKSVAKNLVGFMSFLISDRYVLI